MRQHDGIQGARRPARCSLLLLLLATGAVVIAGCTPWATYPPIEGSTGLHEPWLSPIPDVIAQAVRFAHFEDGGEGEIVINLPEGTPPVVYERVIALLGSGRPMRDPGEVAYHVRQVRVRTVEAQVDLIHRDEHGVPQEMTVTVDRNLLSGFFVSDVRYWRYDVEEPPPYFTMAPVEATSDLASPAGTGADDWPYGQ